MKIITKSLFLFFVLTQLSSCIYMSIKQKVESNEASKISVKFESPKASSIFHSKLQIPDLKKYKGIHSEVNRIAIPFLVLVNHQTFFETKYYNFRVGEADLNKDNLITLKEALDLKESNHEGLPKARITNYVVKGSLESKNNLGCVKLTKIKNTNTPADLYKAMFECINKNKYKQAVDIYMLAAVYGKFDSKRVSDKTAHQAINMMRMNSFPSIDKNKKEGFTKELGRIELRHSYLCSTIKEIGAPNYYPTYMINHRINAFTKSSKKSDLVKNFNSKVEWNNTLKVELEC